MAKTYRIGFASLVHDHVWGELRYWKAHPNVEIVAAGDVNAELRAQFSAEVGIENVYNSWQEMMEKEELDIIQAASENNVGADIVEAGSIERYPRHIRKADGGTSLASRSDACRRGERWHLIDGELAHGMESTAQHLNEPHQRWRDWRRILFQVAFRAQRTDGNRVLSLLL